MSSTRYCFKVRVGVVLLDDQNRLLLARQNDKPFWVLPGGTLEPGESMADCAIRELKEEANLEVHKPQLLTVADFITNPGEKAPKQVVDVVFKVELVGGAFQMETTENINELGFFTFDEVLQRQVRPKEVMQVVMQHWHQHRWPEQAQYLGMYKA